MVLCGRVQGTVTFGQGEPNETVLASNRPDAADTFLAEYNADGTLASVRVVVACQDSTSQFTGHAAALDDGSAWLFGEFKNTVTVIPGPNSTTLTSVTPDIFDILVAKFDPSWNVEWVRQVGGEAREDCDRDFPALQDGSVLLVGSFESTVVFGQGEPNMTTLASAGDRDVYVAKYDVDGALVWAKRAGGPGTDQWKLSTWDETKPVLAGYFGDTSTFGPAEPNEAILSVWGAADTFLADYHPGGKLVRVTRVGITDENGRVYVLATWDDGAVVVGGGLEGTTTFVPGEPGQTTLTSAGDQDLFLAKFSAPPDSDGDGMPDDWETTHGLDPNDNTGANGAGGDPDGDGLTNLGEYQNTADPNDSDSDNDGLGDGDEVNGTFGYVTDPSDADSDDDGVSDADELTDGTDPTHPLDFVTLGDSQNPAALIWSTFLGGAESEFNTEIAVDSAGDVYVAGTTDSVNFPVTAGAFDTTYNGASYSHSGGWAGDAYLAKFSGATGDLIFATYLGGSADEQIDSIVVLDSGEICLAGCTFSPDFPTTLGAFDTSPRGGLDVFVAKFNASGDTLLFSAVLGGSDRDELWERGRIAVDASGCFYLTGRTRSTDFPITLGAFSEVYGGGGYDSFVAKLSADGSSLVYSTYLGGVDRDQGMGLVINVSGEAYVVGRTGSGDFPVTLGAYQETYGGGSWDAFVAKLTADGTGLVYSTFIGGTETDDAWDIALDAPSGEVYLAGRTGSPGFPVTAGAFDTTFNGGYEDVYVSKVNATGTDLVASTFVGGMGGEDAFSLSRGIDGTIWIGGLTSSTNLPTTPGAFDSTYNDGESDAFVAQLNASLTDLLYCTYLGGDSQPWEDAHVAADDFGNVYASGRTLSANFPRTAGAFDTSFGGDGVTTGDSYVLKLDPAIGRPDTDGDGLTDYAEIVGTGGYVTDPYDADSDDDGINDGSEVNLGADPNDDQDVPSSSEVWVDFAYTTGIELGNASQPFDSVGEAVIVVTAGGTVKIKGDTGDNDTSETPRITKAMRIEAVGGPVRIGAP